MSRNATPIPPGLVLVIDNLLASRLDAHRRRVFDEAHTIPNVFLNLHGIIVWEKDRTWSTGRGTGG
jgi:hypothetical protein